MGLLGGINWVGCAGLVYWIEFAGYGLLGQMRFAGLGFTGSCLLKKYFRFRGYSILPIFPSLPFPVCFILFSNSSLIPV